MIDQEHVITSPARLAAAIPRLLDASEHAATRGSNDFARLYASKAAEASASLHNTAMDALANVPRRITKAESQHGRIS